MGSTYNRARLELFVLPVGAFCLVDGKDSAISIGTTFSCTDEMPISQHFVKLTQASLSLFLLCIYVCIVYVELVCAQVNSNNNQHSSPLATDELG